MARAIQPEKQELRSFHVSFVFHNNRLISIGQNSPKTHPINRRNTNSRTAEFVDTGSSIGGTKQTCSELSAFVKAKARSNIPFNKLTLVNVRLKVDGTTGDSCPCRSCQSLISHAGFKKVFYTSKNGEFVRY